MHAEHEPVLFEERSGNLVENVFIEVVKCEVKFLLDVFKLHLDLECLFEDFDDVHE